MLDCILVWFRRDLRIDDHAALSQALGRASRVYCAFVFDTEILDALPDRADRRVEFILDSVLELRATLETLWRRPDRRARPRADLHSCPGAQTPGGGSVRQPGLGAARDLP